MSNNISNFLVGNKIKKDLNLRNSLVQANTLLKNTVNKKNIAKKIQKHNEAVRRNNLLEKQRVMKKEQQQQQELLSKQILEVETHNEESNELIQEEQKRMEELRLEEEQKRMEEALRVEEEQKRMEELRQEEEKRMEEALRLEEEQKRLEEIKRKKNNFKTKSNVRLNNKRIEANTMNRINIIRENKEHDNLSRVASVPDIMNTDNNNELTLVNPVIIENKTNIKKNVKITGNVKIK
jgi:hypothetical protein